jgi:MFS family permease
MDKKTGKLKTVIYIVLAVSAVTFFITLPILCAINGVGIWESFQDKDIVRGLVLALVFGLVFGLVNGLSSGLSSGLVFGLGFALVYGLTFGFSSVLFIGLSSGLVFGLGFALVYELTFRFRLRSGFSSGLGSGLVFGLVFALVYGFTFRLRSGFSSVLVYGLSYMLGYFISFLSIRKLLPLLKKLPEAIKQTLNGLIHPSQLKGYPIGPAIASFIIFYVSTVLIFSLWYYAIYLEDYSFFKIVEEMDYPVWWQFFYFSLTVATVGYGDISPMSIIPQVLVVIEILIVFGLVAFYLTIIFQIIARIEPKDESLQKQLKERDRQISKLISKIEKCNKQQDEIIELTKQNEQNRRRLGTTIIRKDRRQR